MMFSKHLFNKVAIIGTGLIGGSMGMAMRNRKLAKKVVGVTSQEATMKKAIEVGAIDEGTSSIEEAVKGADFIVLGAPVHVIVDHLALIAKHVKRGALVTDVGSSKYEIVKEAHQILPKHALFVGSHPMAGSEKRGAEFASEDFFEQSTCIMTPVDATNKLAKDKVKHLWEKLGANVIVMDPEEHDLGLSFVSHLPHVAAYALMNTIPDDYLALGASGLKDTTRIASSSPRMWNEICMSNQQNVLKSIDQMVHNLSEIRKQLLTRDDQGLTQLFLDAKQKRDRLDG